MDRDRNPKASDENLQMEVPGDPAAAAFEALREEVALLRRGIGGLAAERAAIEIPDYSETLGEIARTLSAQSKRLVTLSERPGLALSAQDWGREIATAGETARRSDQQMLVHACNEMSHAIREIGGYVRSARSAQQQRLWLYRTAAGGVAAGMALFAILQWAINRLFG